MSGNDWGRRGSATGRGLVAVASSPPRFCQRNFYLILRPFHGSTPLVVKIRLAVFHSVPVAPGGRAVVGFVRGQAKTRGLAVEIVGGLWRRRRPRERKAITNRRR